MLVTLSLCASIAVCYTKAVMYNMNASCSANIMKLVMSWKALADMIHCNLLFVTLLVFLYAKCYTHWCEGSCFPACRRSSQAVVTCLVHSLVSHGSGPFCCPHNQYTTLRVHDGHNKTPKTFRCNTTFNSENKWHCQLWLYWRSMKYIQTKLLCMPRITISGVEAALLSSH